MIDTNTIKDRILSFAYQGKLIEPTKVSDDNLELIHGNIKGFIPVSDEEYLINAPKEWKWTRLGYVTSNHGQVTPSDTFSYIDVGTLDNVNHRLSASENIVEAKDAPSRAKKVVETGDVIYSTVRPYLHNICIIDKCFSYTPIASTAFCVMCANEAVLDNKYLFYWLLTKEFDKYSNGDPSKGALYPAIGEKDLLKGVIPLPSVIEQKAIAEKVEAIFEILDKIDALQNQYAFNQEALKSKLIDAAIQGKLTEQLPEDGTAEDLYQAISQKKKELQKRKEIKNSKPLPEILEDEIPFEIPSNWKWVHLDDITKKITSGSTPTGGRKSNVYVESGNCFFREQNIYNDGIHQEGMVYITDELLSTRENSTVIAKDILLNITGGSIGRCALIPDDFGKGSINQHILIIRMVDDRLRFYVHKLLCSPYAQRYIKDKSVGDKDGFSGGRCKQMLIPLPPLAEQNRITETIDNMLDAFSMAI